MLYVWGRSSRFIVLREVQGSRTRPYSQARRDCKAIVSEQNGAQEGRSPRGVPSKWMGLVTMLKIFRIKKILDCLLFVLVSI